MNFGKTHLKFLTPWTCTLGSIFDANILTSESQRNSSRIKTCTTVGSCDSFLPVKEHIIDNGIHACPKLSSMEAERADHACSTGNFFFALINPKAADIHTTDLLQGALKLYMKELPAMNYAANTRKLSTFLEKCIFSGKYCSLVLIYEDFQSHVEVIAAISYQIIPADTQYAEIPIVAVNSACQKKGIGCLLYLELKKRLQSIGVCTALSWGDKESEVFWLKQGFVPVAEVDANGKARKLPVKSDVRNALCFPGGSILMVSHLQKDISAIPPNLIKLSSSGSSAKYSSSKVPQPAPNLMMPTGSSSELAVLANGNDPVDVGSRELNSDAEGRKQVADINTKHQFVSATQGVKRIWEASLSSLMSKKVKGCHFVKCQSGSNGESGHGREIVGNPYSYDCLVDTSKRESFGSGTKSAMKNVMEGNAADTPTLVPISEHQVCSRGSKDHCIMLMNIADGPKKAALTKIIKDLGGLVTSDGRESTHVITGKVRRTSNFCFALCSGAWIVSPDWLRASFGKGEFVDEVGYIPEDEDYKAKYKKDLKDAVLKAKAMPGLGGLLSKYDICFSSVAQPPVEILSEMARRAGGNIVCLEEVQDASKAIFIASEDDTEEALAAAKGGIRTFSSEWLINSVMRQELDLDALQFAHSLCL